MSSVDVRVSVFIEPGAVIVIMAYWVLVSVSVSVSVSVLVSVTIPPVTVTNCVVVSIAVPRPGGLPGTPGVPVGGITVVEILSLVLLLRGMHGTVSEVGTIAVAVLLGVCPPLPGRVTVIVLVLDSCLGRVIVDSFVVVFNALGQTAAAEEKCRKNERKQILFLDIYIHILSSLFS